MFLDEGALARGGEAGRFKSGASPERRPGGTGALPCPACFSVSDGFVGVLRARMMQTDFRLAKGGGLE